MELEPSTTDFQPPADVRPKLIPPPPVRLLAVADMALWTPAGIERELDDFYVNLLRFEREAGSGAIVYRAENFRLRFEVVERRAPREDYRPVGIIVPDLAEVIQKLLDREIPYTRQRGISPGSDSLLLLDPAGNFVEIWETRRVA